MENNQNKQLNTKIFKSFNETEKIECVNCHKVFDAHYHNNGEIEYLENKCIDCRKKELNLLVEKLKKESETKTTIHLKDKMTYEKITLKCTICGEEYEALHLKMLPKPKLCKKCALIKEEQEKIEEQKAIEKHYQDKKNEWLRTCGIPERYKDKTFKNFEVVNGNKTAYQVCVNYAENYDLKKENISICIFSQKVWGVGKSHLSYAIARRIIEKNNGIGNCPVWCITEPELFSRIRSTYNKHEDGETEKSIMNKLLNTPLLIVNDIGKQEVSDPRFVQRTWFEIIDGRYNSLKPVILTANLNPDDMAHYLGGSRNNEATWDRILEMCQEKSYEIRDKSHRRHYETS